MRSVGILALAAVVLAAPTALAAPSDPMMPQECVDQPDAVNCLGQAGKCILRENVEFLYECWGILGP